MPVVRSFSKSVIESAVGTDVIRGDQPEQQFSEGNLLAPSSYEYFRVYFKVVKTDVSAKA